MAIKETTKAYHFTEFEGKRGRIADTSAPPTLSLNRGVLRFNKSTIEELNLAGKFVKMMYDPGNDAIGFRIKESADFEQMRKREWVLVKPDKNNGNFSVSIRSVLNRIFSPTIAMSLYKKMPITKWVDRKGVVLVDEPVYFVTLKDHESKSKDSRDNR